LKLLLETFSQPGRELLFGIAFRIERSSLSADCFRGSPETPARPQPKNRISE
jgi:hypothetical protein